MVCRVSHVCFLNMIYKGTKEAVMGTFNLFMYKFGGNVPEESQPDMNSRAFSPRMTKREMKEIQLDFQWHKEIYERRNGVLMSEERKKALYR